MVKQMVYQIEQVTYLMSKGSRFWQFSFLCTLIDSPASEWLMRLTPVLYVVFWLFDDGMGHPSYAYFLTGNGADSLTTLLPLLLCVSDYP